MEHQVRNAGVTAAGLQVDQFDDSDVGGPAVNQAVGVLQPEARFGDDRSEMMRPQILGD
jgi:hypothetical protein